MNISVTGAAGLIGKNIVKKLALKGHKVKAMDFREKFNRDQKYIKFLKDKNVEIIFGSILNKENCKKLVNDSNLIIHLAAVLGVKNTEKKRKYCLNVNFDGTKNIIKLIKGKKKRIIFASSSEVYGEPEKNPIDENSKLNGKSIYAISKILSEKEIIKNSKKGKNFTYTILRFFNTYGEDQVAQFLIPKFINNVKKKKSLIINGNGNQLRGYLYVDDVVDGIYSVLNKLDISKNKIYNLGNSSEVFNIYQVAKKILKLSKSKNKIFFKINFKGSDRNKNREIFFRISDCSLAKKQLNFRPKVKLETGLKRMLKKDIYYDNWIYR